MLHTLEMYYPLHYEDVQDLQRRLGIIYTQVNQYTEGDYPGVTMSISNSGNGKWKLYMIIDVVKLLAKSNITEKDYSSLKEEIEWILWNLFGYRVRYKDHILLRLDYRYDAVVEKESERLLLMHLYKKLTVSYKFQKKYMGKLQNDIYVPYETTIYHSSKSVQSTVYLKEEERLSKSEIIEDYERNVIRYEVRLLRNHLYTMERRDGVKKRERKLWNYMKESLYQAYFEKYMIQIYYTGDFYKIDEVREVLRASVLLPNKKRKLIDFLKLVSAHNIDTPRKQMAKMTYNNRLSLLIQSGIHPIPIPKNHPNAKGISTLRNPLNDFL